MSPNTKGDKFAWLDPTSIYINGSKRSTTCWTIWWPTSMGLQVDVVGGLDAMGFVLGSALATRLGVGFLPIRKAGKLCVDTDRVTFSNYSGRTQDMEMRKPAFAPGTRVLLADQWVETGGTMEGAIRLVERQQGVVVGMAAIAIEGQRGDPRLPREIPVRISRACQARAGRSECNAQKLTSFDGLPTRDGVSCPLLIARLTPQAHEQPKPARARAGSALRPHHAGIVHRLQPDLGGNALARHHQLIAACLDPLLAHPAGIAQVAIADRLANGVAEAARRQVTGKLAIAQNGLAAQQRNARVIGGETGHSLPQWP
jgi:adenine phosphoribosyltransferase